MSQSLSPSTARPYGVERVCEVWDFSRSTYYAQVAARAQGPRQRPGPKPKVSDSKLLDLVKLDLESTPFRGEGHRKVYRRIRRSHKVGRDRVLRVMRENHLLSPYRTAQGAPLEHNGQIVTQRPREMWGTDGARIETVEDGWVWAFFAVDHFNSECVGWHVAKVGDRFAALQPLSMGLERHFGAVASGAANGLTIRADHGTQYTSDDFLGQVKAWGAKMSYAYVAEPQTNGITERFIRTVKEQSVHGRIYRNVDQLRQALAQFVEAYNHQWLLERLDYKAPVDARLHFDRSASLLPKAA